MRRNGTRPKADKPKDHEPKVQATGIRSVLPKFRAQGQSGIASAQHQAAKIYLERRSADRPAPRTRASGLTT